MLLLLVQMVKSFCLLIKTQEIHENDEEIRSLVQEKIDVHNSKIQVFNEIMLPGTV